MDAVITPGAAAGTGGPPGPAGMDEETFDLLLATVQRFVRERLVPAEDEVEDTGDVPPDILTEMKAMGLYGLSIPERYGGIGLSMEQECDVAYELGQTALAFRSAIGTNVGIGSQGILMDGTEQQRETWLPRIASGDVTISFALTEPGAGSDAAALSTRATLDGDSYVLNGTKRFITNASRADAFTLLARTGGAGAAGISAFIVPATLGGIALGPPDRKMGQRGTKTCDVYLQDVRVPADLLVGGDPGRGFATAMKVLGRGRLHIAAVACGMARRIVQEAAAYARERRQFGTPIAEFQLVQAMLADAMAESYAGRTMVRDCARRYDATPNKRDDELVMLTSCTKLFCTEMVGRVADRGVQVHGGAGYMNEYKVERFYRDVRLLRLYEGTSQIQQLIIGRQLARTA